MYVCYLVSLLRDGVSLFVCMGDRKGFIPVLRGYRGIWALRFEKSSCNYQKKDDRSVKHH